MNYKQLKFPSQTIFLVTGGAGFIGSNLCEAILNMGHTVKCLDNLSAGKQENVDLFINNPNYEFINGDITDLSVCMNSCSGVDYVLHHAALCSVPQSVETPLAYEKTNVRGTLNMLEAARKNSVKRFVYASSSAVYGDEPTLPKKEGVEGYAMSPYALTKKVNEEYANLYTQLYSLETIGLRYFNVFGKRQDPDGAYAAVLPKFITQLLADISPTIHGDGMQSRDFTYIENVIEANLKSCLADVSATGQAYNIAYGNQDYLIDIYYKIRDLLGKNIEPTFGANRIGDIKHSSADISKAKKLLGYSPEYSFTQGIGFTIDWYKDNL